jgi:hypothetical protein
MRNSRKHYALYRRAFRSKTTNMYWSIDYIVQLTTGLKLPIGCLTTSLPSGDPAPELRHLSLCRLRATMQVGSRRVGFQVYRLFFTCNRCRAMSYTYGPLKIRKTRSEAYCPFRLTSRSSFVLNPTHQYQRTNKLNCSFKRLLVPFIKGAELLAPFTPGYDTEDQRPYQHLQLVPVSVPTRRISSSPSSKSKRPSTTSMASAYSMGRQYGEKSIIPGARSRTLRGEKHVSSQIAMD